MAESKFLFGASVQGIQGYIFSTNKLNEIIGGSQLVDHLCKVFFKNQILKFGEFKEQNLLLSAAGNMKYLFENKKHCEDFIKFFLKNSANHAPGIRIVQAVVELNSVSPKSSDFEKLEDLLQIQKNKYFPYLDMGWMTFERSRRTGLPAVEWVSEKKEAKDSIQLKKVAEAKNKSDLIKRIFPEYENYIFKFPYEQLEDFDDNWIAVIHADGNSLGQKIQKLASFFEDEPTKTNGKAFHVALKDFSKKIELATEAAAQKAFNEVVLPVVIETEALPLRPVLLGGDDITIIIEAHYAFQFMKKYLLYFEEQTKEKFLNYHNEFGYNGFKNGFTACAGIAYIKNAFPFHYGAELSEVLCKEAKKVAKEIDKSEPPSCLYFYKVQSSYTTNSYSDLITKELTISLKRENDVEKDKELRIDAGPYFIHNQPGEKTTAFIAEKVEKLKDPKAPASPIRNWLSVLHKNLHQADFLLERINYDGFSKKECFFSKKNKKEYTWVADALILLSFEKIKTKTDESNIL